MVGEGEQQMRNGVDGTWIKRKIIVCGACSHKDSVDSGEERRYRRKWK